MLKVLGILMIIFGALALFGSLIALTGSSWLDGPLEGLLAGTRAAVTGMVSSVMMLVAGVLISIWRAQAAKAQTLFILSIVTIVVILAATIIAAGIGPMLIVEAILPVLFIIAALRNKNATA